MAKLVNLTPHVINVAVIDGDGAMMTVPPSGDVARVASQATDAGHVKVDGEAISLSRTAFGDVQGLPAPEAGTIYVVSALVRGAVPHRRDVASPGDLIRGADGQPIGCRGLIVN